MPGAAKYRSVVPAKAGTHNPGMLARARPMGPRLRGGDNRILP